jgi:hypothetical protein
MMREFAGELGGQAEIGGSDAIVDYEGWQFGRTMTEGLQSGQINAYCLELGVDPLTFATDLLTTTVIDADLFDELFGRELTSRYRWAACAYRCVDVSVHRFGIHNGLSVLVGLSMAANWVSAACPLTVHS